MTNQPLQSWQELSQARMYHILQRFLSPLKNQSLREQWNAGRSSGCRGGGSRQGQLSDGSVVRQTALPHFHPVKVSGNMLNLLSTLLDQVTRELNQCPFISLWTLTKEEKELFCLLPQKIGAFFHAIYLKATFLLHSLSLTQSCNYLAIRIPFLFKLVCYTAYKYVFMATRQVCPTAGTCRCLIQIHGLLFCRVYF